MKKLKMLLIVLFVLPSCQYLKDKFQSKKSDLNQRGVAQESNRTSHYFDTQHVNTFNTLMNNPLFTTDANGQTQEYFIPHVRKFVERQFDYLYIGQSFLHEFDKELDRLVKLKKIKKDLEATDTEKINLIYFQLQTARELYEENLHELADLYRLTLENRIASETNDTQNLKTKTSLILSQLPKWLDEAWDKNFKVGVISVADAIDDVNEQFIKTTPLGTQYIIDVNRFVKISNRTRHLAYLESKSSAVLDYFNRLSRHVEGSARKKYEETFDALQKDPEKLMLPFFDHSDKRTPNAAIDNLYPSPGGTGHISGNRVPKNTWTLTFDDGPHAKHTEGMYKVLNDNRVPAMFFWLSKNMNLYPHLVAQARNNEKTNGQKFNVASHSMTHANLPTLSTKNLEVEITDAATLFEKIVGERPTFFRCPYGACGPMESTIRQIIAKNNMLHVHWNVDTLDWQDKNPQSIFERSKKQIELRGKGIVLFHDVHPQSVEALKILIPYMKKQGYRIIGLPQMVTEIREKEYYSP